MKKTPTELVDTIVQYALYGAGQDDDPLQQEFAADLLEAAVLIMDAHGYDGRMTLTRSQLLLNADGDRKYAEELRN